MLLEDILYAKTINTPRMLALLDNLARTQMPGNCSNWKIVLNIQEKQQAVESLKARGKMKNVYEVLHTILLNKIKLGK